jgi:hypothetical protein
VQTAGAEHAARQALELGGHALLKRGALRWRQRCAQMTSSSASGSIADMIRQRPWRYAMSAKACLISCLASSLAASVARLSGRRLDRKADRPASNRRFSGLVAMGVGVELRLQQRSRYRRATS